MDVVIAAGELRVVGDGEEHVQVAVRAAVEAGLAFRGNAKPGSFVDAGRHLYGDRLFLADAARAAARRAGILDHLAGPSALRAGARDREEALRIADLPAALASGAGHRLRTRFRAGAVAGL